jgi:hypothetical protein
VAHKLLPIEQSEFLHWRSIKTLHKLVTLVEQGVYPEYIALDAIEQHNKASNTAVEYEEVRDLDSTYILCDAGEWRVWVDDQPALLLGDYDEPYEAMANCDCLWVLLQLDGDLHVVQSPYTGHRDSLEEDEEDYISGLTKGPHKAFVLPPEVEAGIIQDLNPDMPETVFIETHQESYYANDRISY